MYWYYLSPAVRTSLGTVARLRKGLAASPGQPLPAPPLQEAGGVRGKYIGVQNMVEADWFKGLELQGEPFQWFTGGREAGADSL